MPVTVRIPTPLRRFAGDRADVQVAGGDLSGVLAGLFAECPGLQQYLVGDDGQLRNFVNVFVNGEDARYLGGTATPVKEGDTVTIVPAIAGGSSPAAELSRDEVLRYSRHLIMPEVTIDGQRRLKGSSALLVGAGGLGSPSSLYLAAAGVGRIGIVDFDVVDETNLQRQIVHDTSWVGKSKLESARHRLLGLNPHVQVETRETLLSRDNALELLKDYDVVVDGTDNFQTRYLTNDACFFLKKPNVYGSIFRFEGQASVFWPERGGPCYRCLYPEPPPPGLVPSCAEGGVLGILPGVIGCLQATEAVKILLGIGEPLVGRLLLFDALAMSFRELKLRKNKDCPLCGENPTISELQDYDAFCGVGRGDEEVVRTGSDIGVRELKERLDRGEPIEVIDVREPHEWAIGHIEGARLVPLASLPERLHEFDSSKTYAVHCKMGARSAKAVALLKQAGFKRVHNVSGGILAWGKEVDPTLPAY